MHHRQQDISLAIYIDLPQREMSAADADAVQPLPPPAFTKMNYSGASHWQDSTTGHHLVSVRWTRFCFFLYHSTWDGELGIIMIAIFHVQRRDRWLQDNDLLCNLEQIQHWDYLSTSITLPITITTPPLQLFQTSDVRPAIIIDQKTMNHYEKR